MKPSLPYRLKGVEKDLADVLPRMIASHLKSLSYPENASRWDKKTLRYAIRFQRLLEAKLKLQEGKN